MSLSACHAPNASQAESVTCSDLVSLTGLEDPHFRTSSQAVNSNASPSRALSRPRRENDPARRAVQRAGRVAASQPAHRAFRRGPARDSEPRRCSSAQVLSQVEALSLADQVAVMRGGELVQISDPVTLYRRPVDVEVALLSATPCSSGRLVDGYLHCVLGRLPRWYDRPVWSGPAIAMIRPGAGGPRRRAGDSHWPRPRHHLSRPRRHGPQSSPAPAAPGSWPASQDTHCHPSARWCPSPYEATSLRFQV